MDITIVIPDFKSPRLDEVINSALSLNPKKIIVSNFETEFTKKIQNNYEGDKIVSFLNFKEKKNPGDYRNEGASHAQTKYILFLDSDVRINHKTINFINDKINNDFDEKKIYWGLYSSYSENIFSKIQQQILRYRFSNIFFKKAIDRGKPYCGQSSHFLIARETFNEIGGFNPYLRIREDNDFCIRANFLDIKSELCEEFEADHLKKYSLYSEYFQKPFHATMVKVLEPKIFGIPDAQIGFNLALSWVLFPILIFFLFSAFLLKFISPQIFITGSIISLLAPQIFFPKKIYEQIYYKEKIFLIFLLPLIGIFFLTGGILGFLTGIILELKKLFISVKDYFVIFYKILTKNGRPIQIINFITSRCNLRCNHCFYKETLNAKDPGEMKIPIIDNYTKNFGSILWYALGGGEPFVRSDIFKLYEVVEKNCRPKVFTIPTNGWYNKKIFYSVLRMLQFSKGKKTIIIQFSIDGNEDMNDKIRGKKSYQNLLVSLERLKKLQKIYTNLHFSIITVVTNENRELYPELIHDLVKFETNQININLFRYGYLNHPPIPTKTLEKYKEAVETYEGYIKNKKLKKYSFLGAKIMRLKEALQKDLIYEVAKNNKFVTPCTAGTYSYVVWEDGRVNACEILPDTIGNINNEEFPKDIFSSNTAKNLRKKIADTKCRCTYECAMSTNTFFSWNMTKKMIYSYFSNRV